MAARPALDGAAAAVRRLPMRFPRMSLVMKNRDPVRSGVRGLVENCRRAVDSAYAEE